MKIVSGHSQFARKEVEVPCPWEEGRKALRLWGEGKRGRWPLVIKQLCGELKKSVMYQVQSYHCTDGEIGSLTHW